MCQVQGNVISASGQYRLRYISRFQFSEKVHWFSLKLITRFGVCGLFQELTPICNVK